jgi:hypothetical protein
MAAKQKDIFVVLPRGTAINCYTSAPDSKAPEGAAFKPDNKYKITLVYDDMAPLLDLRKVIIEGAKAKWPDLDVDSFAFPFREREDDDKNEGLRGKVTAQAKSQYKPKCVDAKRNALPASVTIRGGDVAKASGTLYFYEKIEKVKEGKKTVDVKVRGCSIQLSAIQLLEKRAGGGDGATGFDEEDGFTATSVDEGGEADDVNGDF